MTHLTVTQGDNAHPAEDLMHLLAQAEQRVRAQPTHPEHRWAMVEILCTLCQWDRALAQLQAWAKFVPDGAARAHLTRGLIQAEAQRVQVFLGQQPPGVVVDYPPWMAQLAQALAYNAQGLHHKADDCRQQALAAAPVRSGLCQWTDTQQESEAYPETSFEWLADSDTRLGPVCEVMTAGAYRWLAFSDVARIQMAPPQHALDFIWLPARLQLQGNGAGGKTMHVFLPARSCWTAAPPSPDTSQQAMLRARLTTWTEVGESGIFSSGQKTWMTDGIDWPLLDVREVRT
jgi:type VI secretion system protein ImpE